ncbi:MULTISPECIES: CpaF family protein [Pseudobacillus]|uniref:CpaF family protein n=1 Tax=Pseudobacillus TaxID=108525 RepID=UPI00387A6E9F
MLAYKPNNNQSNTIDIFTAPKEEVQNESKLADIFTVPKGDAQIESSLEEFELVALSKEEHQQSQNKESLDDSEAHKNTVDISYISYAKRATQDKSITAAPEKRTSIPRNELEKVRSYLISEHQKVLLEAFLNPKVRNQLMGIVTRFITEENILIKGMTGEEATRRIVDAVAGMGIIQPLVEDVDITEIMINGKDEIIIERFGREEKTDLKFDSEEDLKEIASKIVNASGQTLTAAKPYADCRFPSMRINITDHHISGLGIVITIRKFAPVLRINRTTMLETKQASESMVNAMEGFVRGKMRILIVGPTGSGKTELLKWLVGSIPDKDRTITLEDTAEMYLRNIYPQKHIVPMECRFTDEEDTTIDFEVLLKNALRQNPNRIIVGESRGPEALLMLEILNTGHPGMTTIHANNARDSVNRLIMMCLRAGVKLDREIIGKWVTSVFDIVIFQQKYDDGVRRITEMIEMVDFKDDELVYNPLFTFEEKNIQYNKNGEVIQIDGHHEQNGYLSFDIARRMLKAGIEKEKIMPLIQETHQKELNLV